MQDRVVVTNDKDFGALVFQERRAHRGVILLRLDDERAETKMVVLNRVLRQRADEIAGNFVVASETTIRVRRG